MIEIYLLLTICVGLLAVYRSRSLVVWIGISLLISPLISAIILLIIGDGDYSICSKCKEKVKNEATICKHCGTEFEDN